MKRLGVEQRIFEINKRLDELVAAGEERAWSSEEHDEVSALQAEMKPLQAQLSAMQAREREQASQPGREDANVQADREGANVAVASKPGEKVFPTLGHQLAAIYKATVNGDFSARNQLMAAASGASEAVDSDGGYLLQDDFAAGIERKMNEVGTLLRLMSPLEVGGSALVERIIAETSRADGSRWGGIQGYWLHEADEITASRPKFERVRTEVEKVGALGYSTDELLEDVAAMSSLFTEGFAEELVFKMEDAIIEGSGAGEPLGILNAPCLITQAKETNQAADTFVTANISNMWNRMPARNRGNAVWLINQELEPQLDELSIPAGTAALEPRFVTYGPDGILRIKGRPVVVIEYCSALGDLGDVILADLSQYRLVRKGGVQQATSMHVKFATDEMAFRATYRVGGQPKWRSAITPFKATANRTVSPFVTLQAR